MVSLTLLYVENQEGAESNGTVGDTHWRQSIAGLFTAHKWRVSRGMERILACPTCNSANQVGQRLCSCSGQSLAHRGTRCKLDVDPSMTTCPYCRETLPVWPKGQSQASEGSRKQGSLQPLWEAYQFSLLFHASGGLVAFKLCWNVTEPVYISTTPNL